MSKFSSTVTLCPNPGSLRVLIFSLFTVYAAFIDQSFAATAKKKPPPDPIKVAFLYDDKIDLDNPKDFGQIYQHEQSRQEYEKSMRGAVITTVKDGVAAGGADEQIMRELIADGHKIFFAASPGFAESMAKLAAEFPDRYFFQYGGRQMNGKNFASYNARDFEGSYVNGLLAGTMTRSNGLGFIARTASPEILQNINAFMLGAQSINSTVTLKVIWTHPTATNGNNPDETMGGDAGRDVAQEAALALINQGVDVLYYHDTGSSIAQTAESKGVYVFGYPSDMRQFAPNFQITATTHNWASYFANTTRKIMTGRYNALNYLGGMRHGTIKQMPLIKGVPLNLTLRYGRLINQMRSGNFNPFIGPIMNNQGRIAIAQGRNLNDAALARMNFLVAGVSEVLLPPPPTPIPTPTEEMSGSTGSSGDNPTNESNESGENNLGAGNAENNNDTIPANTANGSENSSAPSGVKP